MISNNDYMAVIEAVIAELNKREIKATSEYPGFIWVDLPKVWAGNAFMANSVHMNCGTVNKLWEIDFVESDDVIASSASAIPEDSTDAKAIADFIAAEYALMLEKE